jgi:hypothetical protein
VRRVLRAGGRFAYAVIGSPAANDWLTVIARVAAQRGHRLGGDPFGPGGPFSLSDHDRNRALLAEAGFEHVEVTELTGTMTFESPSAYWDRQAEIAGPFPALIKALPAEEVAEIRATAETALEQYATGDGYALRSSLVLAAAS